MAGASTAAQWQPLTVSPGEPGASGFPVHDPDRGRGEGLGSLSESQLPLCKMTMMIKIEYESWGRVCRCRRRGTFPVATQCDLRASLRGVGRDLPGVSLWGLGLFSRTPMPEPFTTPSAGLRQLRRHRERQAGTTQGQRLPHGCLLRWQRLENEQAPGGPGYCTCKEV